MNNENIIISESNRPYWQLIIAAILFTLSLAVAFTAFQAEDLMNEGSKRFASNIELILILFFLGTTFCSQRRVYVDLKKSKIKASYEVGPIKIGRWQPIKNPEYVSVFLRPKSDGSTVFEVNLWYEKVKHIELYERDDYMDAFRIGYIISEKLNIDLLDATVPNESKWIDKNEWKSKINENLS